MPAIVSALRLDERAEETAEVLAPWQEIDPRRESTTPAELRWRVRRR